MKLQASLLCALMYVSGFVHAEGRCPEGFFPIGGGNAGWEGCAPMGPNTDGGADQGSTEPAPAEWETRWGAIATGGGGWGAVTDMRSESQAKKAAIKQCKATASGNGSKCKARTYFNQCAVVAWGAIGYTFQRAIDVPTASSLGMDQCRNVDTNCEIFYSACSYAKRVR
jgi:hypothetical protein